MEMGITGMEASVARFPQGWKQMLWDSRRDGKYFTGFPAGMYSCTSLLWYICTIKVNPTSISFICHFGACLVTMITQIETSTSVVGSY